MEYARKGAFELARRLICSKVMKKIFRSNTLGFGGGLVMGRNEG